jgi:hypothetical protein
MVVEEEGIGSFFQISLLFWRVVLALRAFVYIKNLKLMASHIVLSFYCSLHRAFTLLDRESNPYGETPYSTLDKIALAFGIVSKDVVYDLGSGRGLGVIWWASQVGCRAVGVDQHPLFIKLSKRVKELFLMERVDFIESDFLRVDLSGATVIYLYGTALSDEVIEHLIERFKRLDRGVKIITVSYPLSEYSSSFVTVKEFRGRLPWGKADIYLNKLMH